MNVADVTERIRRILLDVLDEGTLAVIRWSQTLDAELVSRVRLAARGPLQLSVGMTVRARTTRLLVAATVVALVLPTASAKATATADPDYSAYVLNFQNVAFYQSMGQSFVAAADWFAAARRRNHADDTFSI